MGSEYKWNQNPVQDTLLQMVAIGVDISDKQFKRELNEIISLTIRNYILNEEDLVYLDFKIKKSETYFKVMGNNIISALWLSGILPKNPTDVMEANECYYNGRKYTFDTKKKNLTNRYLKVNHGNK